MTLYEDLGVSPSASQSEIKTAYRKQAMKHHPDKGGDPEKFKKLSHAYDILSDEQKKAMYDQTGSDQPQPQQGGFPFDMFNMFQPQQQQPNLDQTMDIHITLEECYRGLKKRFSIQLDRMCTDCSSSCIGCRGRGRIQMQMGPIVIEQPCSNCKGTGTSSSGCSKCSGGVLKIPKMVEIDIEKGVKDGEIIKLDGFGLQNGTRIGALIFVIRVKPHNTFKREGQNIIYKYTMSFVDSVNGTIISVPHFDGEFKMETQQFGVIDPRLRYRIEGKGLKGGDMYIQFDIIYPKDTKYILSVE